MRARVVLPLVGFALAVAHGAHAQPPASGDLDRARSLFMEAGDLERRGDWQGAQERLREALRIRETPNLLYALGWALENNNQLIEARSEYELALRLAQRSSNEEVTRLASQRIAEVDRDTPIVQVRVRGVLAKGSRVLVDGREVPIHGDAGAMPVDPGPRVIRVENAGETSEETYALARGGLRVIEVQGSERVSFADTGVASPAKTSKAPWVLIGGGGVLLTTGILLFASSMSDASSRDSKQAQWCTATSCVNGDTATIAETDNAITYRREADDAASRGRTKQIVGSVLGGVGLVGVGVGVYLVIKHGKEGSKQARFTFDAAPLPGGAAAGTTVSF